MPQVLARAAETLVAEQGTGSVQDLAVTVLLAAEAEEAALERALARNSSLAACRPDLCSYANLIRFYPAP